MRPKKISKGLILVVNGKECSSAAIRENVRSGTGWIRGEQIARNKGNKEIKMSSKYTEAKQMIGFGI